jgi:hypothetical protein
VLRLAFLLFPVLAYAQVAFVAQKTTSLSGAAEVITIQQPASNSKNVELKSAYIDCSVACTVTLERNGNPASTTETTVVAVNPGEGTATAKAYYSSNVGTGTVVSVSTLAAGSFLVFDLSGMTFTRTNQGLNFTLRTSSITGTVNITIKWTER